MSSVPGRDVSVLRSGFERRYRTHTRPVCRSTTVAGFAADQSSPGSSMTFIGDQVSPPSVLRFSTRSMSCLPKPGSLPPYLRASAKASSEPSGAVSIAGMR